MSRVLHNTSTYVPNQLSCLCCVLPIIWCALYAHKLCLAEWSTPCRFVVTLHISGEESSIRQVTYKAAGYEPCVLTYLLAYGFVYSYIWVYIQFSARWFLSARFYNLKDCCMSFLQYSVTHCNTLQCTITHCYTLLHTATHCYTLQHTSTQYKTRCNTRQHTAKHSATHVCHAQVLPQICSESAI